MQGDANCCVWQHSCTAAEINQLAAAPEGNLLAAADDDGCVTIIDPSHEQFNCQKLNGRHDNICSSAVFRRHKPNEGQNACMLTAFCFCIAQHCIIILYPPHAAFGYVPLASCCCGCFAWSL
jgi:hypothetical protein